jgi:ABC-type branched-subunit amino acid transport system ATPase component
VSKMLISARETTGAAIFLVEQNVGFALGLADRYAILKVGEIAETGEAKNAGTLEAVRGHLSV